MGRGGREAPNFGDYGCFVRESREELQPVDTASHFSALLLSECLGFFSSSSSSSPAPLPLLLLFKADVLGWRHFLHFHLLLSLVAPAAALLGVVFLFGTPAVFPAAA